MFLVSSIEFDDRSRHASKLSWKGTGSHGPSPPEAGCALDAAHSLGKFISGPGRIQVAQRAGDIVVSRPRSVTGTQNLVLCETRRGRHRQRRSSATRTKQQPRLRLPGQAQPEPSDKPDRPDLAWLGPNTADGSPESQALAGAAAAQDRRGQRVRMIA